jgi:hypothetical protein
MRIVRRIVVVLGLLLVAGIVGLRLRYGVEADIGAGYGAKLVCSCVFVAGRDFDACRRDFGPEMDPVQMKVVDDAVQAWIPPLLASRTARFHEGSGCTLE